MKTQHTPTPYKTDLISTVNYCGREYKMTPIISPTGGGKARQIALVNHPEDAAHIVKCANLHDELIEALDELMHESPEPIGKQKLLEINELLKRAKGG